MLTHAEKQLILYSKYHFKKTDTIQDLSVLTAEQFGLTIDQVHPINVYSFVVGTYLYLIETGYIKLNTRGFLMDLFKSTTDIIDYKKMIEILLSYMSRITVKGLDLGEADYNLLERRV